MLVIILGKSTLTYMKKEKSINTTSFIHQNTVINGSLTSDGNVHISGSIQGQAIISELLVLDKTGSIIGDLNAKEAKVSGTIEGEVRIEGTLTLHPEAKVTGNIFARHLITEAGALVNGEIRVGKNVDVQKDEIITAIPLQKKAG